MYLLTRVSKILPDHGKFGDQHGNTSAIIFKRTKREIIEEKHRGHS